MEKQRLTLFIILSAIILFGSQYLFSRLYPQPKKPEVTQSLPAPNASVAPSAAVPTPANIPPSNVAQAEPREIKIETPFWNGTLSNQGAVINQLVMTHLPDDDNIEKLGKPIDAPNGVLLVSPEKSKDLGAPLRLSIPSDKNLEKQLNEARFTITDTPESEVKINNTAKTITLTFDAGNGIQASKIFNFNSKGYDFDCTVDVKRNGQPVEAFLVIGPSFGDQNVKVHGGYYSQESISTISSASGIDRHTGSSIANADFTPVNATQIRWASSDDNYFAMAIMPTTPAKAVSLMNTKRKEVVSGKEVELNHVSTAVQITNGQINHIYAGPKNIKMLRRVSKDLQLGDDSVNLERVVNYGWSWITVVVKPIAWYMLNTLQFIYNNLTHNYGWAIIVLTVALNMCFFPLRWRSSVSMKKAAALQPKMKDLQERMKKLSKDDPKMVELQKEQVALMREGNPIMGCLPLFLQMPFFYAVYAVLTTAVEIRHTSFMGWIHDLAAPDPWYILPVVFVISMIVQQALTPSTADPIQKRMQYIMPLFMGYFFVNAPAGLVLYWMCGNLVGITQQYIINKVSPAPAVQTPDGKSLAASSKGKK
jgi:YidC/Oxa1 family membrane protein insertase